LSVASITNQSRFTSWDFAEKVFMIFSNCYSQKITINSIIRPLALLMYAGSQIDQLN